MLNYRVSVMKEELENLEEITKVRTVRFSNSTTCSCTTYHRSHKVPYFCVAWRKVKNGSRMVKKW